MRREHDTLYLVRSQTISYKVYVVQATIDGWKCNCPDHRYRGVCCKHIHSVELSRMMRQAVREESITIIKAHDTSRCKFCGSTNITKKGTVSRVKGPTQQFQCKDCHRRFTDNLGFEYKQAAPEQITMAVELVFSGLSTRKTATVLKKMKVKVSHQTVLNWAEEYGNIMEHQQVDDTHTGGSQGERSEPGVETVVNYFLRLSTFSHSIRLYGCGIL